MVDALCGTWKLVDSQNFDDYMKALNVADEARDIGNVAKPTYIISRDGEKIVIQLQTPISTTEMSFILGEEFEETTVDCRKVQCTVTLEGGKLVQVQKWHDMDSTVVREIKNGKLIMTFMVNDVQSVRTYEKV